MIDITPFTDKLDKVKEYMNYFIEFFDAHRKELDFVYRVYKETGNILYRDEYYALKTFEEWLQLNTNNTFKNQTIV